jgi:hypothetical protein
MHEKNNLELFDSIQSVIVRADDVLCTIQKTIDVKPSLFNYEIKNQLKVVRGFLKEISDYQCEMRNSTTKTVV